LVLRSGRIRRTAIAARVINPRRRGVSGKWREQCHNLSEYLFDPVYGVPRGYVLRVRDRAQLIKIDGLQKGGVTGGGGHGKLSAESRFAASRDFELDEFDPPDVCHVPRT